MPEMIPMDFPQAKHRYQHSDQMNLASEYISHQQFYPEIITHLLFCKITYTTNTNGEYAVHKIYKTENSTRIMYSILHYYV